MSHPDIAIAARTLVALSAPPFMMELAVHPARYSQGQCALFCFTQQIDGPAFASLGAIAQSVFRREVRELHQIFHVSTK